MTQFEELQDQRLHTLGMSWQHHHLLIPRSLPLLDAEQDTKKDSLEWWTSALRPEHQGLSDTIILTNAHSAPPPSQNMFSTSPIALDLAFSGRKMKNLSFCHRNRRKIAENMTEQSQRFLGARNKITAFPCSQNLSFFGTLRLFELSVSGCGNPSRYACNGQTIGQLRKKEP